MLKTGCRERGISVVNAKAEFLVHGGDGDSVVTRRLVRSLNWYLFKIQPVAFYGGILCPYISLFYLFILISLVYFAPIPSTVLTWLLDSWYSADLLFGRLKRSTPRYWRAWLCEVFGRRGSTRTRWEVTMGQQRHRGSVGVELLKCEDRVEGRNEDDEDSDEASGKGSLL
ncbi:hypothetical protein BJ165DRAFT_1402866 [Panaeolus papilionaceus]|nr:hypothetical protein BJ165DRAFT_1402866 [Panaeolus papilionaceus]